MLNLKDIFKSPIAISSFYFGDAPAKNRHCRPTHVFFFFTWILSVIFASITWNLRQTRTWDFITDCTFICTFLSAAYNDTQQVQMNDDCLPDQYFIQEDSGEVNPVSHPPLCISLTYPVSLFVCRQVRNNPKRSCQFNRSMLEECSGFPDRSYGYSQGQPCVLIKLNRVCWNLVNGCRHTRILHMRLNLVSRFCLSWRRYTSEPPGGALRQAVSAHPHFIKI